MTTHVRLYAGRIRLRALEIHCESVVYQLSGDSEAMSIERCCDVRPSIILIYLRIGVHQLILTREYRLDEKCGDCRSTATTRGSASER